MLLNFMHVPAATSSVTIDGVECAVSALSATLGSDGSVGIVPSGLLVVTSTTLVGANVTTITSGEFTSASEVAVERNQAVTRAVAGVVALQRGGSSG